MELLSILKTNLFKWGLFTDKTDKLKNLFELKLLNEQRTWLIKDNNEVNMVG